MKCKPEKNRDDSDIVQLKENNRSFDRTATAWLIGQAIRHLNTAGDQGEFEYKRSIELLTACNRDLFENIKNLYNSVKDGDAALRWNLLYILGDSADERAAEFLLNIILQELPEEEADCCESPRDLDILVATGAVLALQKIAQRHRNISEYFIKIIASKPEQAIYIEAVKAALELGLKEHVQNTLVKEDHWILQLKRIRPQELYADPEREDNKERSFTPPKFGKFSTSPKACHCHNKEG